jgi:hypothetical protein
MEPPQDPFDTWWEEERGKLPDDQDDEDLYT